MFIQVIRGRAKDSAGLRKQTEVWQQELKPGAVGYLGSTGGVSPSGEFVMVVRFESVDAARRNSERPEQGRWWSETEKYIDSPTFLDCDDVSLFLNGGSDDAGFVQVITGRARDRERLKALDREMAGQIRSARPDVIGGTTAFDGDMVVQTVYFTSEKAARQGESQKPPPEAAAQIEEWQSLIENVGFIDLPEPWLNSA